MLLDAANQLVNQLNQMRSALRQQTAGRREAGQRRHQDTGLEDRATKKFNDRTESGYEAEEDNSEVDPGIT